MVWDKTKFFFFKLLAPKVSHKQSFFYLTFIWDKYRAILCQWSREESRPPAPWSCRPSLGLCVRAGSWSILNRSNSFFWRLYSLAAYSDKDALFCPVRVFIEVKVILICIPKYKIEISKFSANSS